MVEFLKKEDRRTTMVSTKHDYGVPRVLSGSPDGVVYVSQPEDFSGKITLLRVAMIELYMIHGVCSQFVRSETSH